VLRRDGEEEVERGCNAEGKRTRELWLGTRAGVVGTAVWMGELGRPGAQRRAVRPEARRETRSPSGKGGNR
jgi:hypothetical protein